MRKCIEAFKVLAKSENTNSFGLYQLILVNRDGLAYKVLANSLNAKDVGSIINQEFNLDEETGRVWGRYFNGGYECQEKIASCPADVLSEIW